MQQEKTESKTSSKEGDIDAEGYIPVVKEAVIGKTSKFLFYSMLMFQNIYICFLVYQPVKSLIIVVLSKIFSKQNIN